MSDIQLKLKKGLSSEIYQYLKIWTYRSYKLYGKEYYCDVCVVKDKQKDRTFVRLQKRWFGLSKKMKANGEVRERWIVIKSYNFPQEFEFMRTRKVFEEIANKRTASDTQFDLGEDLTNNKLTTELNRLTNKIERLENVKTKDSKTKLQIKELRQKLSFLDEENKIIKKKLLKTQLPEFKQIIKNAFLDLAEKGESHFQKLFTSNKWIFGPAYEDVIPKRKADVANQPDFVLKRYDGFSDIVEIESPAKPLFTKPNKSKKCQPSSLLIQSVSQVMDYIESYNEKYKELFYEDSRDEIATPIHAYYPRGIVIIGKDDITDRKKLRQLNNFLHNITVLTYDEFLKQAERMVEIMGR